ncbi:hypothetical protein NHQ30_000342 [Ciborinia camelliae]|nr:hypothetical protein NHQ30_000342 [Ciborinia camelliae]
MHSGAVILLLGLANLSAVGCRPISNPADTSTAQNDASIVEGRIEQPCGSGGGICTGTGLIFIKWDNVRIDFNLGPPVSLDSQREDVGDVDAVNTNTVRTREDASPDTSSDIRRNYVISLLGPLAIGVLDNAPIIKKVAVASSIPGKDTVHREHRNSRRCNPSPPATLECEEDENTTIGNRDTPSLIGGIIIGARDGNVASSISFPNIKHRKRETESQSRAINPSPPATVDKRDIPDPTGSLLEFLGLNINVDLDSVVKRAPPSFSPSANDPSSLATLTAVSSRPEAEKGEEKDLLTRDETPAIFFALSLELPEVFSG